jgi:plastocyanin
VNAGGLIVPCLGAWVVANAALADCSIEGVVQLPAPTAERPLSQRYRTSAETAITPSNPPAAIVYLEGDFPVPAKLTSANTAAMTQKNILFAPDLLAVRVGTAVEFPNLDDTYHNVFSYSKAKRFDLGRYRKNEKAGTILFDRPGVVSVHCEIHDRMHATILVLETPFFQKTDSAGHFRLDHLPLGHFTLKAWINQNDIREQAVDLKGEMLHVDFPAK